jgi:hypothetical protein
MPQGSQDFPHIMVRQLLEYSYYHSCFEQSKPSINNLSIIRVVSFLYFLISLALLPDFHSLLHSSCFSKESIMGISL